MIEGALRNVCRIEMDAAVIDFSRTYCFQIEHEGRPYVWRGVRPMRDGNRAVFDWDEGHNGSLTADMMPSFRFLH